MVGLSKGAMRGPKLKKGLWTRDIGEKVSRLVTCQIWLHMEKWENEEKWKMDCKNRVIRVFLVET